MIPRIIHQIWIAGRHPAMPARFVEAVASWAPANPGWEHRLWTGPEIEALFAAARPDLLELYRNLGNVAQRADAGRYLILHEHGGVYADVDIVCTRSLEPLIHSHPVVLSPTEPLGVSNDLMMAAPRHPLFEQLLDRLPASVRRWDRPWVPPHFRVMCGTASLHLTRVFRSSPDAGSVRLLGRDEYGHGDPALAFVRHVGGNSWAGWDTHVFVFLGNHWKALAAGAAAALTLLLLRS